MYRIYRRLLLAIVIQAVVFIFPFKGFAQSTPPEPPLTSQELVRLVYALPKHPEMRDEIVETIRQRGIGFPLTDGMRSLVAAKSGSGRWAGCGSIWST